MRIGELAERAGTSTRTLRYYESRGLLAARRTGNGYRDYDEDDLRLLRQIRTLQDFGFELEETRPFVDCLRAGHPAGDSCPASSPSTGASSTSSTASSASWPASASRWPGSWPPPRKRPGPAPGPSPGPATGRAPGNRPRRAAR